jgi:hypothetical protein
MATKREARGQRSTEQPPSMGEHAPNFALCAWRVELSAAFDAVDRFIQPRRQVSIRRDENDFVVVFQPEDLVVFRHADASALRRACHFLRWEVVNAKAPRLDDPAS